jgi:hypothetical protein
VSNEPQPQRSEQVMVAGCEITGASIRVCEHGQKACEIRYEQPPATDDKPIKVGDWVMIAPTSEYSYEVAELKQFPHGIMVGIYDEPPSKHIDYWNIVYKSERKAAPRGEQWTPEYVAGLMARSPLESREASLLRGYKAISAAHNAELAAERENVKEWQRRFEQASADSYAYAQQLLAAQAALKPLVEALEKIAESDGIGGYDLADIAADALAKVDRSVQQTTN